jgi:hypothetical protein
MRTCTAVVVLSLMLSVFAGAGFADDMEMAEAGSKQIVFGFSGWNLGSYEGGLGFRYFIDDALAIRAGIDFGFDNEEDQSYEDYIDPESDDVSEEYDDDSRWVGTSVLVEKYTAGYHSIRLFYGGGLAYTYAQDDRATLYHQGIHYSIRTSESTTHTMKAVALMGFQWYFAEHISLGGEYRLTFRHWWFEREEIRVQDSFSWVISVENDGNSLDGGAGQLMVSIRF